MSRLTSKRNTSQGLRALRPGQTLQWSRWDGGEKYGWKWLFGKLHSGEDFGGEFFLNFSSNWSRFGEITLATVKSELLKNQSFISSF